MFTVVSPERARRTETPNATMTTLASPTVGATSGLSLWRVEMAAGQQGPWHSFDAEQLWTVESGIVTIQGGDGDVTLKPGDTIVVPAGLERRVSAVANARMMVCGTADAVATARGEDTPRGTPAWIS